VCGAISRGRHRHRWVPFNSQGQCRGGGGPSVTVQTVIKHFSLGAAEHLQLISCPILRLVVTFWHHHGCQHCSAVWQSFLSPCRKASMARCDKQQKQQQQQRHGRQKCSHGAGWSRLLPTDSNKPVWSHLQQAYSILATASCCPDC
jgi:hypothetical protein